MLSNCVISWLYMCVLTLTWGNLISINFPQFFLVFQCGASGRSTLTSGRTSGPEGTLLESGRGWSPHVRTGPDGVRTRAVIIVRMVSLYRPDARNHSAPFWGSKRPDVINPPSERGPHSGYKNPARRIPFIPHKIWTFGCLRVICLWVLWFFAYSSHISGIFLVFFSSVFFKLLECYFF
jgi:hypothetical protein